MASINEHPPVITKEVTHKRVRARTHTDQGWCYNSVASLTDKVVGMTATSEHQLHQVRGQVGLKYSATLFHHLLQCSTWTHDIQSILQQTLYELVINIRLLYGIYYCIHNFNLNNISYVQYVYIEKMFALGFVLCIIHLYTTHILYLKVSNIATC